MGWETVKIVGDDPEGKPAAIDVGMSGHLPEPFESFGWRRPTTAQTNAGLWDPIPNQRIVVYGLIASSTLANVITFNMGGIEVTVYLPDTGGCNILFIEGGFKVPAGGNITFTSTVATPHYVAAYGRMEH